MEQEVQISLRDKASHAASTTRRSLSLSIRDGFFASVFATCTGGPFLAGFALALGANEFHIGVLAALPLVANFFQFVGSYLVSRLGSRKRVSVQGVVVGRGVWLLLAVLPLLSPWLSFEYILMAALAIVAVGHFAGAISAVAWLSWMSDVVPDALRGRFFGRRNMINSVAVIGVTMLGGQFIDWTGGTIEGFQILFVVAVAAGFVSVGYLKRIAEPRFVPHQKPELFFDTLLHPLRDVNFRWLLLFAVVWNFGVHLAAPFFVVYKLQDLMLSYTVVGFFVSLTAFVDVVGMRFWGPFSDRVGNRPVMLLCSIFAAVVPFLWLWTSTGSVTLYLLLPTIHVLGGFFWAGMNLTSANILFRVTPKAHDTVYFSVYAAVSGLSAALAALVGGALIETLGDSPLDVWGLELSSIKIIFLISWLFRSAAIPLLRRVREPKGLPLVKAVQVLRSIHSMNSTQGFHPLLHFFIAARGGKRR